MTGREGLGGQRRGHRRRIIGRLLITCVAVSASSVALRVPDAAQAEDGGRGFSAGATAEGIRFIFESPGFVAVSRFVDRSRGLPRSPGQPDGRELKA